MVPSSPKAHSILGHAVKAWGPNTLLDMALQFEMKKFISQKQSQARACDRDRLAPQAPPTMPRIRAPMWTRAPTAPKRRATAVPTRRVCLLRIIGGCGDDSRLMDYASCAAGGAVCGSR